MRIKRKKSKNAKMKYREKLLIEKNVNIIEKVVWKSGCWKCQKKAFQTVVQGQLGMMLQCMADSLLAEYSDSIRFNWRESP